MNYPGQSVLVVKMSAPLVTVSAMVSSESEVTVNMPGQLEGNLNIYIYASCTCRLCDDSEELGYTEHECKEEREILWVNMVTYEITCGNVKILLHLFS